MNGDQTATAIGSGLLTLFLWNKLQIQHLFSATQAVNWDASMDTATAAAVAGLAVLLYRRFFS